MYEDGICEIVKGFYSKTIAFTDINYRVAVEDEQKRIFNNYCELLNSLDPSLYFQITIINRRINQATFEEDMLRPEDETSPYYKYHKEINETARKQSADGENSFSHEKYITFSAFCENYTKAIATLKKHEEQIMDQLEDLGCVAKVLDGLERLTILHNQLNPDESFNFRYDDLIGTGLNTKDYIAPSSLDFKASETTHCYKFGDKYGQSLFCKNLPRRLTDELIEKIVELPINMAINIHINPMDKSEAIKHIQTLNTMIDANIIDIEQAAAKKNTNAVIPYNIAHQKENFMKMQDDLINNNQNLFRTAIFINSYADNEEELNENLFLVMSTAKSKDVTFDKLNLREEEAFSSNLPIGYNSVEVEKTLTTSSTAIFVPFTTQEIYHKGGIHYGQNSLSKNPIYLSRKFLSAPNGYILGKSGSGKSFAAKQEIVNVLINYPEDEVIVIDPEREFQILARELNGESIIISSGSPHHLNPMDINMSYSDDQNPLDLKTEYILSICELILGGNVGLEPHERSIIDLACRMVYKNYMEHPEPNNMPTLKDFHRTLSEMNNDVANKLATSLDMYANGSLSVFAHKTNVNINNRFVVYDIRDLGTPLKTFGMMAVLDQIWNRITANKEKGINTWFYTDEYQLLTKNEFCAEYYFQIWSRSRKYGAIPTAITQNASTIMNSETSSGMLANCDFALIFRQEKDDRDALQNFFNLSGNHLKQITNSNSGNGLLYSGSSIIPFSNEIDTNSEVYKLISTKFKE